MSLAERPHQFLQSSRLLDFEEDFVVAVRNLDVQVLATSRRFRLRAIGRLAVIRHRGSEEGEEIVMCR